MFIPGKFLSFSRKLANRRKLARRRTFRRQWLLQRLEARVVLSWTPLADVLAPPPQSYCTQADVGSQIAGNAKLQLDTTGAADLQQNQPRSGIDAANGNKLTTASGLDQLFPAGDVVDQVFAGAGTAALARASDGEGLGNGSLTAQGSATASASAVPSPFWRKLGDQPTYAPSWYANQGAVTHEVYYNASLTSAQNGALLQTVLSNLSAGDHVRIHGGTYSINSYFKMVASGTAEKPITVEGAPGEQVIITRADAAQNTINIDQAQYLIIEGVTIKGGSTGLKLQRVDHFMLHNVEVWDTANNAVAANSQNTSYLYFIDNDIHDTGGHGEGFYLGASNGSVVTHHTYVIGNYIHDLDAADVSQGDGIEVKDGSYAVTIKYNFIENTKYPGIIVYRTGRGMTDRNLIEENVVLNSNDNGIQASADAIIRNNLVVTPKTAFFSQPFGTAPQNLTIVNNTFVAGGDAVKTYSWASTSNTFANNAIYSGTQRYIPTGTGNATTAGNVMVSNLATAFVNLRLDRTALDATPAAGSPLIGAANTTYLPPLDLTGEIRVTEADVGAVDHGIETPTQPSDLFDFGTDTSPVGASQTRVAPSNLYSRAAGYGWLTAVGARDRGALDDVRRDFNFVYSGSMTFATDLPSGTYEVTIVTGDQAYGTTGMGVLLEGQQVETLSRAAGKFLTKTYLVDVVDGQLTLTLASGSSGGALINSLKITPADGNPDPGPGPGAAGIVVTPTSGLTTSESGSAATFTVVLSSVPTSDVLVGVSSSDTTEGTVSTNRLTFTPANWNQPQTVTVTGADDALVDGTLAYSIVLAAAQSTDAAYNGLNPTDVTVTNSDNDTLAASGNRFDFGSDTSPVASGQTRISPSIKYSSATGYGWLSLAGARDRGTADSALRDFNFVYTGSLTFGTDLPSGTYQVTIVSGDSAYGTTGMGVLLEGRQVDTLSRAAGQFLTRTYEVDVTDGQLTLVLTSGSSGGALINSLQIVPVTGNPAPAPGAAGFVVTPPSGLTTSEAGSAAAFTVALTSQPTSNVVVGVASSDSSEGSVSTAQLTFTTANWNQPQTVNVTGVDDALADGNVGYTVVLAAAQSSDVAYSGLNPTDVTVSNSDDELVADTFDFGSATSPVAANAKQVTPANAYSSASGYGWVTAVGARDRGEPDAARRDFNFVYNGAMTFAADLPSGAYQVTIVSGDEFYGTTGMGVILEGQQVDTLSRAAGQYLTKTYLVNVTDGQLTVALASGSSGGALINTLTIAPVV